MVLYSGEAGADGYLVSQGDYKLLEDGSNLSLCHVSPNILSTTGG